MRDLNKYWVDGPFYASPIGILGSGEYRSLYGDHYYLKIQGRYFKWTGFYIDEKSDKKDIIYWNGVAYEETDLSKDPEAICAVRVYVDVPIDILIAYNKKL